MFLPLALATPKEALLNLFEEVTESCSLDRFLRECGRAPATRHAPHPSPHPPLICNCWSFGTVTQQTRSMNHPTWCLHTGDDPGEAHQHLSFHRGLDPKASPKAQKPVE